MLQIAAAWLAACSCWGCQCESSFSFETSTSTDEPSKADQPRAPKNKPSRDKDLESASGHPAAKGSYPDATTQLTESESAYAASLHFDESALIVLTPEGIVRLEKGQPKKRFFAPLSASSTLVGDEVVYFSEGKVRAIPAEGGAPRVLGPLDTAPQRFFAAAGQVSWLTEKDGRFHIATFDDSKEEILYRTKSNIVTATDYESQIVFIQVDEDKTWRVGSLPFGGSTPKFSQAREGRPPSMLAPNEDGIFLYDGPNRSVLRISHDLDAETTWAQDVICSPLAVSDRVICGHVGGLYEVRGPDHEPSIIAAETAGPVTTIAASDDHAFWIAEVDDDEFALKSVPLADLDDAKDD